LAFWDFDLSWKTKHFPRAVEEQTERENVALFNHGSSRAAKRRAPGCSPVQLQKGVKNEHAEEMV
jgi:hypothetical protein